MDSLVSIIIPVYNTAKYLDACLESVVNQTYSDLQIILIDDGSTDGISPGMCDLWGKKDNRIQVIHKENEGLGFTRNAGLDVAKGQFVCFLDSDDTLDLDTISTCERVLEKTNADACFFPRKTYDCTGKYTIQDHYEGRLTFDNQEEVRNEFSKVYWGQVSDDSSEPYIHPSVCRGMFLRSTIESNRLRFLSERECLSEDVVWGLEFCKVAKKVVIIPKHFYNYTYNDTSLTKSYRPQRIEQAKRLYEIMESRLEYYYSVGDVKNRLQHKFVNTVQQCVEMEVNTVSMRGIQKTISNISKLCNDEFIQKVLYEYSAYKLRRKRKIFVFFVKNRMAYMLFLLYYIKSQVWAVRLFKTH